MLSRRSFLGYSFAGIVTAASGCRPAGLDHLSNENNVNPLLANKSQLASQKQRFLGYPINMNNPSEGFFHWRAQLKKVGIGDISYNNVGNPYTPSPMDFNTHDLERDLIQKFGKNYHFPTENTWGFLSHSGTDSNMHGMYMGRTILESRTGEKPICYFTEEAHYSIQILSDLLGMKRIFIATLPDASMDPEDLKQKISLHPNHPPLVVATIGTTFKGAIDNVNDIQKVLNPPAGESGKHEGFLHLDAALFGGYLPHTNGADLVSFNSGETAYTRRYDSIAISCHKFFGFPYPAGLFITTQDNFNAFNKRYSTIHNPEYIGHVPGTITCSRDAVKPAEFHYFSTSQALAKQAKDADKILKNTSYLLNQLQTHFADFSPSRTSELSNTIFFRKPGDRIVRKYSLATMRLNLNGIHQDFAHAVIMPHVSKSVLSEFLNDLEKDNTFELG